MAFCPKCGRHLNIWHIKAECPTCGVNIPNYDWEGRLNEDAEKAKIAWSKFNKFTGNFKSALFGNKLRIIRPAHTTVVRLPGINVHISATPKVISPPASLSLYPTFALITDNAISAVRNLIT